MTASRRLALGGIALLGMAAAAAYGVLLLGLGLALLGAAAIVWARRARVPTRTVLELDLRNRLIEYVPPTASARALLASRLTLLDVVRTLERAATDPRVVGLLARVGGVNLPLAQAQELRDAIEQFRQSGKPAIAYATAFGDLRGATASYYLACACDRVFLQPAGTLMVNGLTIETAFLRGAFEKLGIQPRFDHRREYKIAMNRLVETEFTEPHRETVRRLLDSQFGQVVRGIAAGRGRSEEEVRDLCERGLFSAEEAEEANLIDAALYWDQVLERLPDGAELLPLADYRVRARWRERGDTVALIYGVGNVLAGTSGFVPGVGLFIAGGETIGQAFRQAVADRRVQAILFRVDCDGGSAVGSMMVDREVALARRAGKPVIVSMSTAGGSGGYGISMSANKIVAQPATNAGGIGLFAGKLDLSGLWERLGISWDEVHTGRSSTFFSFNRDFTPEQWETFQHFLDLDYEGFTDAVAAGRGLPKERVLEVAKGRQRTGEDAKQAGLVDELGGFRTALALTREAAGIPPDAPIRLREFPPRRSLIAGLLGR